MSYVAEVWTEEERAVLERHFTNVDGPVFALVDLPQVVAGALFSRYSRSAKSLRRLFLDEFVSDLGRGGGTGGGATLDMDRAERLYRNVFDAFGDDSVAQLGGAHLAVEQGSNVLTKLLQWGRLAAYLEQSTRYVPYTDKPGGGWRYHTPTDVAASPLAGAYRATLDRLFERYASWLGELEDHYRARFPHDPADPKWVWKNTITARACDDLRGLLPAATVSNMGIFATGQAYEALLLRLRAHPLAEARAVGEMALVELRKVIPSFLMRVDRPDRGGAWSDYLARTEERSLGLAEKLLSGLVAAPAAPVTLTDFDPQGEEKVVTAILYPRSRLPEEQVAEEVSRMGADERLAVLREYVGERGNRRHKPGRAFERTSYRFDILCDYGAFRDLQRHRMCTIEWQPLSALHGYETPDIVGEMGWTAEWDAAMSASAELHHRLGEEVPAAAAYAVAMAHRIRFALQLNAREAMHLIELRSSAQGHPAYRAVAREMHRQIAEVAGHRALAESMSFVDFSEVDLERLEAERRVARRREGRITPV